MPHDPSLLWLAIVAIGGGTFLIRYSFIWLFGRAHVPPWLRRALRFVPPAVLSALVLPSIVLPRHAAAFTVDNPRLWAGLAAAVVAAFTENVVYTIAAGMGALWIGALL